DWVYEIANPFAFRGTTYISKSWAEARAADPSAIRLPAPEQVSLAHLAGNDRPAFLRKLPQPLLLTLAATSTDPTECAELAEMSCGLTHDATGAPSGLRYAADQNGSRPVIQNHDLFETVVNNPHLPEAYKKVMVLRPGAQGGSEIVGEYGSPGEATHVFEYLRRNSYIPGGHYAANMADDAVRYAIHDLTLADMTGLRHLYYQRTYVRLAEMVGISVDTSRRGLTVEELEALRRQVVTAVAASAPGTLPYTGILWGWNFGFDFAGSGYRLHASHQQIHQQYALVPPQVAGWHDGTTPASTLPAFASGDQIADHGTRFREETGQGFFACYLSAIRANQRMDGREADSRLIIHEDDHVLLFVPKAQVSQWELQIMTKREVGNILEADTACRASLDQTLLLAQKILATLGARLVTSIEYSKRIDNPDHDQRLLYSLLPKLPYSMGAFSEAQLRWINGHYPEDFAIACRQALSARP
ncbi:MAG TPA: hypothetical protein VLL73_08530, partial [Desulfurivibrionaceae bacterium]|nr:hypothetical protein [Desulfurivibrionaceae bacterium]